MPTGGGYNWEYYYDSYIRERRHEEEPPPPKPKYKILINNVADTRPMLEKLFRLGYVFNAEDRFRTFDKIFAYYGKTMEQWQYIRTHFDEECKMVIGYIKQLEWSSIKREYTTVDLDKFLYEIAGHEKPKEDKLVVSVAEFNEEFEKFRKKTSTAELVDMLIQDAGIVQYTGEPIAEPSIDHIRPMRDIDNCVSFGPAPTEGAGTPNGNTTGGDSQELRNSRRIRLRRIRRNPRNS